LIKTLLQQKQPSIMGINMRKSAALLLVFVSLIAPWLIAAEPAFYSAGVAEDSWATKARMHVARSSLGVAVVNCKIYAIGGNVKEAIVGTNEEYDPATDTWETKTPMPTARAGLHANVASGKVYLIGEYVLDNNSDLRFSVSDLNEVYDPTSYSWTTKASMPTAAGIYARACHFRFFKKH
jgi:hypothetical protein